MEKQPLRDNMEKTEGAKMDKEKLELLMDEPKSAKPNVVGDLVMLLQHLLQYCLCCVTCGCYPGPKDTVTGASEGWFASHHLSLEEKEAAVLLLSYIQKDKKGTPVTINADRQEALRILSVSGNPELQRSAAMFYLETSMKLKQPLTPQVVEPLLQLLKSPNVRVQKAATLALSNLILHGPEHNKETVVNCGALRSLIRLMSSCDKEVQCNTCGCITTLSTTDSNKERIVLEGGVDHLILLTHSADSRVERNACGALLNLTHLDSIRSDLVNYGVIPTLVNLLKSNDSDIQYYCSAALSNIAVTEKHRTMIVAIGNYDVIKNLVLLLRCGSDKVKCQVCLVIRNLATDADNQIAIVRCGALLALVDIIKHSPKENVSAAMACLRNLSTHQGNMNRIIDEGFIDICCDLVRDCQNSEAQVYAAGVIKNLALRDKLSSFLEKRCVESLGNGLLDLQTATASQAEITGALVILTDRAQGKKALQASENGKIIGRLITMAMLSSSHEVRYNSASVLAQLKLNELPENEKVSNTPGIVAYLDRFLKAQDPSFVHVALWTLIVLMKDEYFIDVFRGHHMDQSISSLLSGPYTYSAAILSLAEKALNILHTVDLSDDN